MSRDGVRLGTVGDEQESWIWSCKAHPTSSFVVRTNVQSFSKHLLFKYLLNHAFDFRYSAVKTVLSRISNSYSAQCTIYIEKSTVSGKSAYPTVKITRFRNYCKNDSSF